MEDDLCECIDEKSTLETLKIRYSTGKIYTNISKVLIAINPNSKNVSNLYTTDVVNLYMRKSSGKTIEYISPHVYAIANKAVTNMRENDVSQTILITGESGAGKTESSKHLIQFLCNHAVKKISKRIIESTPLLEEFGNASTTKNRNSSRFCKLVEFGFDERGDMIGGRITAHLLETNRVCHQNSTEKNFRVFETLLYGAPELLRDELKLNSFNFHYMMNSSNDNNQNYCSDYQMMMDNLKSFDFSPKQIKKIQIVIASILHIGNFEFDNDLEGNLIITSRDSLDLVSRLLKMDRVSLQSALTIRTTVKRRSEEQLIPNTIDEAVKARDSLARFLYSRLFSFILQNVNRTIDFHQPNSSIGIFDLAGFECFGNENYFEQMCINYVNEKIHQVFVKRMLKEEQVWYSEQNLDLPKIDFFDNSEVLDLFENKQTGIFSVLKDSSRMKNISDENFKKNIEAKCGGSRAFSYSRELFCVKHFSEPVQYTVKNFVEKNVIIESEKMLRITDEIMTELTENHSLTVDKAKNNSKQCVTQKLMTDIDNLIDRTKENGYHFIRCIKANKAGDDTFDEEFVAKQLDTSGSFAYQRLMKIGFPSRIDYRPICSQLLRFEELPKDPKILIEELLLCVGLKETDFKIGSSKLFLRPDKLEELEKILDMAKTTDGYYSLVENIKQSIAERAEQKALREAEAICLSDKQAQNQKGNISNKETPSPSSIANADCSNQEKGNIDGESQSNKQLTECISSIKNVDSSSWHVVKSVDVNGLFMKLQKIDKNEAGSSNSLGAAQSKKTEENLRYDKFDHFAILDSKLSASRCKYERCNMKTHVYCTKCYAHLCFTTTRNCFWKFHHKS